MYKRCWCKEFSTQVQILVENKALKEYYKCKGGVKKKLERQTKAGNPALATVR